MHSLACGRRSLAVLSLSSAIFSKVCLNILPPRDPSLLPEVSPSELRSELQTACSDGKNPGLAIRKPGSSCLSLWWKVSDTLFSGSHDLSLSDEAVIFYVTFCDLVIWWRGPRLGLSLRWAGDGNGCYGTTTEYWNILEVGCILLAWGGVGGGGQGVL